MSDDTKDKGVVLLTTLLVMAVMAAVSVALIDQIRFAVKRAGNVQDFAQADWYLKGAEDFAEQYLSEQLGEFDGPARNLALQSGIPAILPIDGGTISLFVRDGGQCVSLNSVIRGQAGLLRQLFETIGWSPVDAAQIMPIIQDWVDEGTQVLPGGAEDFTYLGRDPAYRTPNAPFTSFTELRLLEGMSEERYRSIRPFACVREIPEGDETSGTAGSEININTLTPAQAPLLAAILGGVNYLQQAEQLILDRPSEGYTSESLRASPIVIDIQDENSSGNFLDYLTFEPQYFWVEARIDYLSATRIAAFEFSIENDQLTRLYRGLGEEALRPIITSVTP